MSHSAEASLPIAASEMEPATKPHVWGEVMEYRSLSQESTECVLPAIACRVQSSTSKLHGKFRVFAHTDKKGYRHVVKAKEPLHE